jgi:hypothetical protein
MCRERGVCGGYNGMHTGFWLENHSERDNLEDTVVGRIILKYFKNGNGSGGLD